MSDDLQKLKKHIEEAIGLVAAEYGFAKRLHLDLEKIEKEEPQDAHKDIRKGFKILRWIGRGQRKVDRTEHKIFDDLESLGEILPNELKAAEEKLLKQLEIAEGKLLEAASMFTGELRDDLHKIETHEQLLEKFKDDERKEKIHAGLTKLFADAQEGIADLIKWLSSTEAILKGIAGFETKLESFSKV